MFLFLEPICFWNVPSSVILIYRIFLVLEHSSGMLLILEPSCVSGMFPVLEFSCFWNQMEWTTHIYLHQLKETTLNPVFWFSKRFYMDAFVFLRTSTLWCESKKKKRRLCNTITTYKILSLEYK